MDDIIQGLSRFRCDVFPDQSSLYRQLARDGQHPKALVVSCADSRVVPELITQSGPGDLFVCRNAGNIVPPFPQSTGGVAASIEYAVVALEVRDIVVCGHSHCGAMKALLHPQSLDQMPNVRAWLQHGQAAREVLREAYAADLDGPAAVDALAQENVVAQLNHLRTHPAVAARIAAGQVRLHGWYFRLDDGVMLGFDGALGRFVPIDQGSVLPLAQRSGRQQVAAPAPALLAAE